MEKDPEASGTLTVRDFSESGHLHGEFDVANGSFPQSVRSNTRSLWMKFTYHFPKQQGCQHFKPCLRFLLRLSTTAGTFILFFFFVAQVFIVLQAYIVIQCCLCKILISKLFIKV